MKAPSRWRLALACFWLLFAVWTAAYSAYTGTAICLVFGIWDWRVYWVQKDRYEADWKD